MKVQLYVIIGHVLLSVQGLVSHFMAVMEGVNLVWEEVLEVQVGRWQNNQYWQSHNLYWEKWSYKYAPKSVIMY